MTLVMERKPTNLRDDFPSSNSNTETPCSSSSPQAIAASNDELDLQRQSVKPANLPSVSFSSSVVDAPSAAQKPSAASLSTPTTSLSTPKSNPLLSSGSGGGGGLPFVLNAVPGRNSSSLPSSSDSIGDFITNLDLPSLTPRTPRFNMSDYLMFLNDDALETPTSARRTAGLEGQSSFSFDPSLTQRYTRKFSKKSLFLLAN